MRKLHWVSMALIAAPVVFIIHCTGDDTTPAPGTSTTTAGGNGGTAGAGGGGGATGGTAGSGGRTGSGGTAGSGGGTAGGKTDGGGGGLTEGGLDVSSPTDAPGDAPNLVCADDASMGNGRTCNDYCDTFMANCNDDPGVAPDGGGGFYRNPGDCRQKCGAFNQAQLCCYAFHVNNAAGYDAGTMLRSAHCMHAAGLPPPAQTVCPAHP